MRIEPLRDMILVRPWPRPAPTSNIVVVRVEQQPAVQAEVRAVGPETRDVRVGQQVIISRLQGLEINLGEPLLLLPEAAVLGFVEE